MRILILSCSLNPDSRSARLAVHASRAISAVDRAIDVLTVDLRDLDLPMCDGASAYEHPAVGALAKQIKSADAVLLAVPIYNYDVNAAAKNAIELTGPAWTDKTIGLLCAAGGHGSYMSAMSLANSMMLDFRCLVVPRFVYAAGDTAGEDPIDPAIATRIDELAGDMVRLARALSDQLSPRTSKPLL